MATGQWCASAYDCARAERYPLHLELEVRRHLLAGEEDQTYRSVERFLDYLQMASGGDLARLRSQVVHAIIILCHKSLQDGIPVHRLNFRILSMSRRMERIETWGEVSQSLRDVVREILEKMYAPDDDFCRRVRNYIQAHLHQTLALGDLAETMRVEPIHLSRMFTREMGIDFRGYLSQARIQEAKRMLVNSGVSVAEVAVQVGYQDVAYFIRVFKRMVGITPGEYARRRNGRSSSCRELHIPRGARDQVENPVPREVRSEGKSKLKEVYPWSAARSLRTALLSGDLDATRRENDGRRD